MKILALDIGDRWVGTAISDALKITCRPYKTVELKNLTSFLTQLFQEEDLELVVVGYPKTFSGKESEQTIKVLKIKENLENNFSHLDIKFLSWDERLSSKRASDIENLLRRKFVKNKQDKIDSHSIAAAFILQSYLDSLTFV